MVSRGEVWWFEEEGAKARPYLIVTRDEVIPALTEVLAVPATRTVRGIATEVQLDEADGMPEACVLNLDNARPIVGSQCTQRITRLGPERMAMVCSALAAATGCRTVAQ